MNYSMNLKSCLLGLILLTLIGSNLNGQSGSDTDFLYARKLFEDKMYSLSAQEFTRFIRTYPTENRIPDARYYAGMSFFYLKQYDPARREFQFLAIDFPKDKRAPDAWQLIAQCYTELGDYLAAANALASLSAFYPTSPNALKAQLDASDLYLKANDLKSAKDKLQKLINEQPDIPEAYVAHYKLSQIFTRELNYDLSLFELQTVIDKAKDQELKAMALYEKARVYEIIGKLDMARTAYQAIVNRFSKTKIFPEAYYQTALILSRERNTDESQKIYAKIIQHEQASVALKNKARIRTGDNFFLDQKYDKANQFYKAVLAEPYDPVISNEARFKSGLTYERLNNLRAANEQYRVIIDSLENAMSDGYFHRLAVLRLAKNLIALNQFAEANQWYEAYLKKYPDDKKLDLVLFEKAGLLEQNMNSYHEATAYYEQLIANFPRTRYIDQIYLHLATAYRHIGRIEKSKDLLEAIPYKFPGSDFIDAAENEAEFIDFYFPQNSEITLENMIYLFGHLIEGRPKEELELQYGKLFFYQLKNYTEAVKIFNKIIRQSKQKSVSDEALYYLALCYDRLYRYHQNSAYQDSALAVYKNLTASPFADWAALRMAEINLGAVHDDNLWAIRAKPVYSNLLERYPNSKYADLIVYRLGTALRMLGEYEAPADSDSIKKKNKGQKTGSSVSDTMVYSLPVHYALPCFDQIIGSYPNSRYRDDAYYSRIMCFRFMNKKTELNAAVSEYMNLFSRGKHIAKVKYLAAQLKIESKDYTGAVAVFNDLIKNYYYTVYADSAVQGIGYAYLLSENYSAALEAYNRSLSYQEDAFAAVDILQYTNQPHRMIDYHRAYAYERMNNQTKAVELYEAYLYPDYQCLYAPQALLSLAGIHWNKKDLKSALKYYALLTEKYPQSEFARTGYEKSATIYFDNEQFTEARSAYQKLLDLTTEPVNKMAIEARIIVCTYRSGKIERTTELEKAFEKKYEKEKNLRLLLTNFKADFLYELGRHYQYTIKNYDLAAKTYQRLLSDYPSTGAVPEAWYQLGIIRFNQGKSKEGFDLFRQVSQKYPDADIIPNVYLRMAVEAFKLEQAQTAIDAAKYALQHPKIQERDKKSGMDFLIKVYKTVGYHENALVLIQQYLDTFPDDEPSNLLSKRIDIGIMHRNLKSYDRAVAYLKDLLRTAAGEDEAEIQYNIAQTYYDMGNFRQALLEFLRIPYLEMGAKYDWATAAKSQAAECYVKLQQYQEAIDLYEEILKKHGHASDYGLFAKQRIQELKKQIR